MPTRTGKPHLMSSFHHGRAPTSLSCRVVSFGTSRSEPYIRCVSSAGPYVIWPTVRRRNLCFSNAFGTSRVGAHRLVILVSLVPRTRGFRDGVEDSGRSEGLREYLRPSGRGCVKLLRRSFARSVAGCNRDRWRAIHLSAGGFSLYRVLRLGKAAFRGGTRNRRRRICAEYTLRSGPCHR